jgi:hypothetical protein
MGVDLIVFGLSSVDGFHIEGVTEHEGNGLFSAEISDPVLGEHTLYSNHDVLLEGSDEAKKCFWVCMDVLVNPDVAPSIQDTDEHVFGMKVDSTIKLLLFGVEFHMASSF